MLPEAIRGLVTESVVASDGSARTTRGNERQPEPLVTFTRGFLRTELESIRFLWQSDACWRAVTIRRRYEPRGHDQAVLTSTPVDLPAGITSREVDVLTLVALGLTNGEISARLGTRSRTVSTQIERLLGKLGQSGRGGLAAIAVDAGLVRLPVPGGVDGLSGLGIVEVERASANRDGSFAAPAIRVGFPGLHPIVLGTVMSYLGASASDGVESVRGASLAVGEVNESGGIGGRRLEHLVVKTDIYDEESVRRAFHEFVDQKVDAITASFVSAENPFVLDMVADYGCPFLHTATFEANVRMVRDNPARYPSVFQTSPSELDYGRGFVRFIDELRRRRLWTPAGRRIISVEIHSKSEQIANDVLMSKAEEAGWDVVDVIRVPADRSDWDTVIDRIRSERPDVVLIAHWVAEDLASLQTAIYNLGLPILVYYVYGASAPHFSAAAGHAAEGVIWSTVTGRYDDSIGRRFQDRYFATYGSEAGWSAASAAYDQVRLLTAAWSATGSRDFRVVCDHLRNTPHRGLNGVYYLGNPGQTVLGYPDAITDPSLGHAQMIYQIQGSRPRPLAPPPNGDITAFRTPAWFPEDACSQS